MVHYDFLKLSYALIEQFITASLSTFSPELNDFQNIQEVIEMCSEKLELIYFLVKFSKNYLQRSSFLRMH